MGLFTKKYEPNTLEEYVQFFDSIPAERRNVYLKYIDGYNELTDTLFTSYTSMTDFYDYEAYRLETMGKRMKAPRGEALTVYHMLDKLYSFHPVRFLQDELYKNNGTAHFNLRFIPKKPKYFADEHLYFEIDMANYMMEKPGLMAIASNTPGLAKKGVTYFFIDEKFQFVCNVNKYFDETPKGIEDTNNAGKFISTILEKINKGTCHTLERTRDTEKLEVLDKLLEEAKCLREDIVEETTETTSESTRDRK